MLFVRVYDGVTVTLLAAWPSTDAAANQTETPTEKQTLIKGIVFMKILCWFYAS